MSDHAELLLLARRVAFEEGARRAAGLLFNMAALLLAEDGITDEELQMQLYAAFLRVDINELDESGERH